MAQAPGASTSSELRPPSGPPAGGSPWIIGRGADLILFVLTPLLVIPGFFLLKSQMSIQDIALYVLAFGALGHHLPGMMRAYGDKALFREYRTRFILAPIALAALCVSFTLLELRVIILAVYVWGVWHGLMQTYGFVRIYDAKRRSVHPWTQKLDLFMCIAWFTTGVIWSDARFYQLLEYYYLRVGAPLPPAAVLDMVQWGFMSVTLGITGLFLGNYIMRRREGLAPSPIKLLLMASSFGFWWWANMAFANMLVGVVLFEVFHDIQYLSIVWVFNRGRTEKDPNVGGFTKFLFRRSGLLVGLYVGLVFAYGGLRFIERGIDQEQMRGILTGMLAASTLLHFYYDGFIWKFRKASNTDALDINRDDAKAKRFLLPGRGWAHGAKWAVFMIPLIALGVNEKRARGAELERLESLAALIPDNPYVHHELGNAYRVSLRDDEAIERYREALRLGIDTPATGYYLGSLALSRGENDEAVEALARSVKANPHGAVSWTRYGDALAVAGRTDEARAAFERAVDRDADQWRAWFGMAELALLDGDDAKAIDYAKRGIGAQDAALFTEGGAVGMLQYDGGGGLHYERLVRIKDPAETKEVARRAYDVAVLFANDGKVKEAEGLLRSAIALHEASPRAWAALGDLLAATERPGEAVAAYDKAYAGEAIPDLLFRKAQQLETLGKNPDAIEAYRESMLRGPHLSERALSAIERLTVSGGASEPDAPGG